MVFRGEVGAPVNPRLEPVVDALAAAGLTVDPVAFHPDHVPRLEQQLGGVGPADGVLVWADPIGDVGDRTALDAVLRQVEAAGAWVSARPDVIDRLGTKEVLVATRDLGWGSDAHLYRDADQLRTAFPARLAADGVRVLKASRGNGGRTVWKVSLPGGPAPTVPAPDADVVVQHARVRDGAATRMTLADLCRLVEDGGRTFGSWGGTGGLVDQEFVPGITQGIVRCYLVGGAVVGFARQYPEGVRPDGPLGVVPGTVSPAEQVMGLPSPKTMYPPGEPALAALRTRLESDWVPGLSGLLGLRPDDLPALWDVDLLIADPDAGGSGFALCEVNASSVIPFPPEAPDRLARHVADALSRRGRRGRPNGVSDGT